MRRTTHLLLILAVGGSKKPAEKAFDTPNACLPAEPLPVPICTQGTDRKPGMRAFVDRTHAWVLDPHVEEQRISVTDFDGGHAFEAGLDGKGNPLPLRGPNRALTTQTAHLVSGHQYWLIPGRAPTVADLEEST